RRGAVVARGRGVRYPRLVSRHRVIAPGPWRAELAGTIHANVAWGSRVPPYAGRRRATSVHSGAAERSCSVREPSGRSAWREPRRRWPRRSANGGKAQVTQASTDSADPPGSVGAVGRSRTLGPVERPSPAGPIERVMSTVIRKLAWSRLSDPRVAVTVSGLGLLPGMNVAAAAPDFRQGEAQARA